MPPKGAGRGASASRRTQTSAARNDDQEAAAGPSNPPENASSRATPSSTTPSARPPVQRLQSLNRRTPGGSIGPRGSLSRDEPGSSKPVLKFAPRSSTRRNKEERDAMQALEEERNRQRMSEAAEIRQSHLPRTPMARGGKFRGRGGMAFPQGNRPVGRGGGFRRGGRGGGPGSGSGSGSGGPRVDFDSHAPSKLQKPISRPHTLAMDTDGDYSSDEDEREAGLRISIDQINLDNDSEDEADAIKSLKGKKAIKLPLRPLRGPRPVRVEREEHEERVVSVNTDAVSTISPDSQPQVKEEGSDNELFLGSGPETRLNQDEPRVKQEPTDGDVLMADTPQASSVIDLDRDKTGPTKSGKKAVKDPRSLLRTKEEIDEYDRHNHDLETLKEILTHSEPVKNTVGGAATEGEEGSESKEEAKDGDESEPIDKHAGRLYLIQFPPLMPNLTAPVDSEQVAIDVPDDTTEDVMVIQESHRVDNKPEVKREEDLEDGEKPRSDLPSKPPGKLVTATQQQLPAGQVGRLNLHKSGRVTLDWGGISFELDKGVNVRFVQEALISSTSATAGMTDEETEKCVWSMGQLSEKLIASPEWDKLL